jgi:hypothetical protein
MWTLEAGGSQLVFCVLIAAFCMEHALQQRVQQLKGEYDDLISRIRLFFDEAPLFLSCFLLQLLIFLNFPRS